MGFSLSKVTSGLCVSVLLTELLPHNQYLKLGAWFSSGNQEILNCYYAHASSDGLQVSHILSQATNPCGRAGPKPHARHSGPKPCITLEVYLPWGRNVVGQMPNNSFTHLGDRLTGDFSSGLRVLHLRACLLFAAPVLLAARERRGQRE